MDSGLAGKSPRPGMTSDGIFMHELDIFHEHLTMSDEERATIAQYIWDQENVELSTIGIDIGSSTSHLLFAKVLLQRRSQGLSSRFAVVHRQVVWRSPIMLTPFLPDGAIDAGKLGAFIADCYREAGFTRVYLEVTAQNSGAVRLYRRLGFRQTKVVFKAAEVRDEELAYA